MSHRAVKRGRTGSVESARTRPPRSSTRRETNALSQLQAMLRELTVLNRKLEQRNTEVEEFNEIVSHDLQAPLRRLCSYCDLLRQDLSGPLGDDADRDLHAIADSARAMMEMVSRLFQLSRSGNGICALKRVSLDQVADDVIRVLDLQIQETKAHIECEALPDVLGDPQGIRQLYLNLIGNALKFRRDQASPRIRLTADIDGSQCVLGVRDNGIGIPPGSVARIFTPFTRLRRSETIDGTGLGLSICRRIVEQHGGTIWVESLPGNGAHFRFVLRAFHGNESQENCVIHHRPLFTVDPSRLPWEESSTR